MTRFYEITITEQDLRHLVQALETGWNFSEVGEQAKVVGRYLDMLKDLLVDTSSTPPPEADPTWKQSLSTVCECCGRDKEGDRLRAEVARLVKLRAVNEQREHYRHTLFCLERSSYLLELDKLSGQGWEFVVWVGDWWDAFSGDKQMHGPFQKESEVNHEFERASGFDRGN